MRNTVRSFVLISVLAFSTPSFAIGVPAHLWSKGTLATGFSAVSAVAVDASGNIYAAGPFSGTLNLGGSNLVAPLVDLFVVKYTPAGAHVWSKRCGTDGSLTEVFNIAVDGSGNVLLAGYFEGTVEFGGAVLSTAGADDMFLAKLNATGGHVWSKKFGTNNVEYGQDVAADASGNVLFTGYGLGAVNFGGGAIGAVGTVNGFVVKFNSAGTHQWSKTSVSTLGECNTYTLGVDASGGVVAAGRFFGTVNFGGANLGPAGVYDIFLVKYNSSGVHQWSQRYGGTGADRGYALAIDASDNIVLTGDFLNTVDFGGGNLVSAGGGDVFLAKYTSAGAHVWSKRFGGSNFDQGWGVSVSAGGVALTGPFTGTASFGGATFVATNTDAFLAKFDAAGTHVWSRKIGGNQSDYGYGVGIDAGGAVTAGGQFQSSVDFGGGPIVETSNGSGFVARYGANVDEAVVTSIVDIGNDQGKQVRITLNRSGHDDVSSPNPVTRYDVYRRIDTLPALRVGNPTIPDFDFVGTFPSDAEVEYSWIAPTLADSTISLGQHMTTFLVRAHTATFAKFYDSAEASGYSLDNLAPGVPLNFVIAAGQLTWDESSAADFDFFTVYGGSTGSFGAATLIDYSVDPELDVNASPYAFYFVTATDFSGNEGAFATLNTLTGAGGTPTHFALSLSAYPNPFNPETTVRYTLPSSGRVTIDVFDARGAHVVSLVDAVRGAGAYTAAWNGRDARGGPVGSGVYFARLTSPFGSKSYKLNLLK